jgi:hypothetical protein
MTTNTTTRSSKNRTTAPTAIPIRAARGKWLLQTFLPVWSVVHFCKLKAAAPGIEYEATMAAISTETNDRFISNAKNPKITRKGGTQKENQSPKNTFRSSKEGAFSREGFFFLSVYL